MKSTPDASVQQDEFRRAFTDSYGDLHAFVRRRSPAADVEAIVAESFTVAWRRWHGRPTAPHELRPWLFGIARNVMRSIQRHESRRGHFEAHGCGPSFIGDAEFEQVPDHLDIGAALNRLSPTDREIILLVA